MVCGVGLCGQVGHLDFGDGSSYAVFVSEGFGVALADAFGGGRLGFGAEVCSGCDCSSVAHSLPPT